MSQSQPQPESMFSGLTKLLIVGCATSGAIYATYNTTGSGVLTVIAGAIVMGLALLKLG